MLLLALALAGCGGPSKRDEVEKYVQQANTVQKDSARDLARANQAYAAFARQKLAGVKAETELTDAERSIRATRTKLAALHPPADAKRLHQRLLHLYDLDASMAAETTALGRYLPAAQSALRPLTRINARLRTSLRTSKNATRQADALNSFATGLAGLITSLRALAPPPVLAPTHEAQIARLARTRRLSLQLRGAIEARDAKAVARTLVRFRKFNSRVSNQGGGLQAAALRAYGHRYDELTHAAAAVQRERSRLERTLG